MHSCESDNRQRLTSYGDETLPSPVSVAPTSAEYEKALVSVRLHTLEEENRNLLERIIVLENESRARTSSKPPEFEVQAKGIRIRGKQIVGIAMTVAAAIAGITLGIAYFMFRK